MNSWDDMKGNLTGWFDTAAHRTDRLARLGVRAYDRYGINRDLDRQFGQLGALVHRLLSEDPEAPLGEDAAVRAQMGRIARLQEELSSTDSEMDELRTEIKTKPEEGGAAGAAAASAAQGAAPEEPVSPPVEPDPVEEVDEIEVGAEEDPADPTKE